MEYSINELAELSGISTRALRYYDQINLLSPSRVANNNYRVYRDNDVDLLQQILFYKELGLALEKIKSIIKSKEYDGVKTLNHHLQELKEKRKQIDTLIQNVEKTIASAKGDTTMSDSEKFEGFKSALIEDNELKYGDEIRKKYGDSSVDDSNDKIMGLSEKKYKEAQELSIKLNTLLKEACKEGDPSSELAKEVCNLHRLWLGFYWKNYTKEAHRALSQTYVEDPRFKKYYDDIIPGGAVFLSKAIAIYTK